MLRLGNELRDATNLYCLPWHVLVDGKQFLLVVCIGDLEECDTVGVL